MREQTILIRDQTFSHSKLRGKSCENCYARFFLKKCFLLSNFSQPGQNSIEELQQKLSQLTTHPVIQAVNQEVQVSQVRK